MIMKIIVSYGPTFFCLRSSWDNRESVITKTGCWYLTSCLVFVVTVILANQITSSFSRQPVAGLPATAPPQIMSLPLETNWFSYQTWPLLFVTAIAPKKQNKTKKNYIWTVVNTTNTTTPAQKMFLSVRSARVSYHLPLSTWTSDSANSKTNVCIEIVLRSGHIWMCVRARVCEERHTVINMKRRDK